MAILLSRDIFQPQKTSDIVSIFDRYPENGKDLLIAFVVHRFRLSAPNTFVHFLCFEKKPSYWKKRIGNVIGEEKIIFYDFWYDSHGWNDASRLVDGGQIISRLSVSLTSPNEPSHHDAHLIVIDSTTLLSLTIPVNHLCLLLAGLSQQLSEAAGRTLRTTAVLLHHSDLFDVYAERALQAISSSSIKITAATVSSHHEQQFICAINHQARRETTFNQLEKIGIDTDWKVRFEQATTAVESRKPVHNEVDPTANVPFNLKLTDEEKHARNAVTLPHVRGGGVIYYEPDEADDIDYEDPDE